MGCDRARAFTRAARIGGTLALLGWALAACASDATPLPEPAVDTPGAFVAADFGGDNLTLFRTLDRFEMADTVFLFVTRYRDHPASFEEARELAKDHDLAVGIAFEYLPLGNLEKVHYEVVWFRTLTAEEKERVP